MIDTGSPNFKIVIPARYASKRLHGKPLLPVAGKPMILHVCERARESGAAEILVATDDERIKTCVEHAGFAAMMTQPEHSSGTERIAEVTERCGWSESDIIVNLQGDEPLMPPALLQQTAAALAVHPDAGTATLATPLTDPEHIFNPNTVKVVLDQNHYALYFSRAAIPWDRDNWTAGTQNNLQSSPSASTSTCLRHIGLYAYTAGFIQRYVRWSSAPIEAVEYLEQLRILWHGERIYVKVIETLPESGVDTAEDLHRAERILSQLQHTV